MKCAFVALLALLSAQAGVPSARVVTAIEMVCANEAKEQTPQETRRSGAGVRVLQSAPAYASRIRPEPDTAALFQRPPPSPFSSRN
jgi:hypothetical protein